VLLLGLPRRQKRLIQVLTDVVLVWVALWLAFVVRLGIDEMVNPLKVHLWLFICASVVAIPLFIRFGMY
jgi:FlaA1/EpsC-like NDP-sugar epimerase